MDYCNASLSGDATNPFSFFYLLSILFGEKAILRFLGGIDTLSKIENKREETTRHSFLLGFGGNLEQTPARAAWGGAVVYTNSFSDIILC